MKLKTASGSRYLIDGDQFQRLSEIPIADVDGGPDSVAPCGMQGNITVPHLLVQGGVVIGRCACCNRTLTSTKIIEVEDG